MKCYHCSTPFEDPSQEGNEIAVCDPCDYELAGMEEEDFCEDLECGNCGSPGSCPCE